MKNELKLCPFCGSKPSKPIVFTAYDENKDDTSGTTLWEIQCSGCFISMSRSSKKEVVEAWNKRLNLRKERKR